MTKTGLTVLAVLTLVLFCAGLTSGSNSDPAIFDYRQIVLENGLRVITLEDFSCPIVAVQLWYHVGSKDEDPARQGFAHMFEHMLGWCRLAARSSAGMQAEIIMVTVSPLPGRRGFQPRADG